MLRVQGFKGFGSRALSEFGGLGFGTFRVMGSGSECI